LWNLNDVLNLRRFHTGPDPRRNWILFMWTPPVVKLLKNLVLIICPFFLLGLIPKGAKIIVAMCGDSSLSIRELWSDIDKLDEIPREGTSVMHVRDASVCGRRPVENATRCSRREGKKDSLNDVPGTSNIRSKGRGGNSAKKEAW
jgi:hypothetical protein